MEANISSDYGTGKCRSDEGLDKIQKSDKDNHTRNQGVELSTIAQEFMKEILLKKTYKTFVRQQGWEISCKITAPTQINPSNLSLTEQNLVGDLENDANSFGVYFAGQSNISFALKNTNGRRSPQQNQPRDIINDGDHLHVIEDDDIEAEFSDMDKDSTHEKDRGKKRITALTIEEETAENIQEVRAGSRKGLKKGDKIDNPRAPNAALMLYNTDYYINYDWARDHDYHDTAPTFKGSYSIYDHFKLLTGPTPRDFHIHQVPRHGVRLDDNWVGLVTGQFPNSVLADYWPAEFDTAGMLRATRVSLGSPCLIWICKGQKDIDGVAAPRSGCYYAWYRGLQLLCGKQGLDKGIFQVRPSHEELRCKGLAFKNGYPALNKREEASFRLTFEKRNSKVEAIGKRQVEEIHDVSQQDQHYE